MRLQRKRTKGYRLPPGAVYVGRGSRWGNPYKVGAEPHDGDQGQTLAEALWAYRNLFLFDKVKDVRRLLRGKDLVCWCPLTDKDGARVSCHADILLELAND